MFLTVPKAKDKSFAVLAVAGESGGDVAVAVRTAVVAVSGVSSAEETAPVMGGKAVFTVVAVDKMFGVREAGDC